ncbi:DUF624 domain-containing protein [Arthrobacter sp.]|uniref:DUF624 domain-containing protein n=1 Tax=Arthrobacter sp. TaxID=1667 RepID=UPI002810E349|nr:DUF624 domain-containing protein [Arthrobacter sp.]
MNEEALGWAGRLMLWLDFAVNLVLINLLFVTGVLAGGIVPGLFPSAVAASTMLARLRTGTLGEHPVRDFITAYRSQFLHANKVGSIFWVAAAVLVLNGLSLVSPASLHAAALDPTAPTAASSPVRAVLLVLSGVAGAATLAAAGTAVDVCTRYRDTVFRTWRLAFMLPLASPLLGLSLIASYVGMATVFAGINVLIPLIGASLPLLLSGWLVGRHLSALEPSY